MDTPTFHWHATLQFIHIEGDNGPSHKIFMLSPPATRRLYESYRLSLVFFLFFYFFTIPFSVPFLVLFFFCFSFSWNFLNIQNSTRHTREISHLGGIKSKSSNRCRHDHQILYQCHSQIQSIW